MRILINIPSLALPGGVANHYKGLLPYWSHDVKYNVVGGRGGIPGPVCLIYDYAKFILLIILGRYDLILLNPSLGKSAILRDSFFLFLAKLFRARAIVFFHGWDLQQQALIDNDYRSFVGSFGKADAIIVLANEFANKLRAWGIASPVFISSTKVDDRLLSNFEISKKKHGKTILFLARVEEKKGIFVAINAFHKILASYPDARLMIAGSGSALNDSINAVKSKSIPNVEFLGHVSGDSLINAFSSADIYLLPTHGEGMPTSVLEAMAFGLPVITRPVGGLKDFFKSAEMGFMSESLDSQWYADTVCALFQNSQLMERIGCHNHTYAKRNFMASQVARQLEEIFEKI